MTNHAPLKTESPMPCTPVTFPEALSLREKEAMHLLTEKEFVDRVVPQLPLNVTKYYLDLRMGRKMTHKCAYAHTLQTAKLLGLAVGLPGLPAHESRLRLLLRSET